MVLASLEASMASAVHGIASVIHPSDGTQEPLSLFSLVVAGPTTGKSRTYRKTHQAHLEEDRRRHTSYLAVQKGAAITHASDTKGRQADRVRWVSLQNVTNRALIEALEGIGESTAVASDEGQNILSSDLFKHHLDTCNSLYDGSKVMLNRARGQSVIATDASLVALVMVQPDIFGTYLRKYGEYARGVGFIARTLFTIATPPQCLSLEVRPGSDSSLVQYHSRVESLLREQRARAESGQVQREPLQFTPEASALFTSLALEQAQNTRTRYAHMEDAANRALQNVIRLAAIMHAFNGEPGHIPAATLLAAYHMVQWHLAHFSVLFPTGIHKGTLSAQERSYQRAMQRLTDDRNAVLAIIGELCRAAQSPSAFKSEVQTLFRAHAYDSRFRAALLRLKNEGFVIETGEGKASRLSFAPLTTWPPQPAIATSMPGLH
ncbi:DUF3987 domain-containing protein [Dyella sp. A6]|uniref:DUF3987 domain-containing protein n=1 Tax=Dyella aluminiiresistens TaxID=3069105 RepID=UPI002E79EDD4|nr:DUF3987 domain-containing protein [Dyella sp. A6]